METATDIDVDINVEISEMKREIRDLNERLERVEHFLQQKVSTSLKEPLSSLIKYRHGGYKNGITD